jgi:hypothetical protein
MRRRCDRAWAEPEEGDDRWGPPTSRAWRGVKKARGDAFPMREVAIGQGTTDARPVGPAERPRPSGERGSSRLEKRVAAAGLNDRMGLLAAGSIGPKVKEKFFSK